MEWSANLLIPLRLYSTFFAECPLKSLREWADFDSTIRRFESSRPASEPSVDCNRSGWRRDYNWLAVTKITAGRSGPRLRRYSQTSQARGRSRSHAESALRKARRTALSPDGRERT